MTRKLLFLLFPLLFLTFVSIVNAQTASNAADRLREQMQFLKDQKQGTVVKAKTSARVDLRQQIKDQVQTKREEVKEIVAARKEEFKAKLQIIRDEKKKALVERIDAKLANVNLKHTDRFTQVLSNLQTLLDKISPDVNILEAQAAIDAAQMAVENQAAKTYIITISTETALRSDAGAVTSQLRQDLVATHKLVVAAKQAVQKLNTDRELIKKEATNSAGL
jgi:hypothetical protein